MLSDDQVIQSVIEGHTQHFEILIDRYKVKILNFINRMIFDPDEAQNIGQEVFVKVFERLKKYKKQDNFQAYLFTIAKNLTLNYISKQKRLVFLSSLPTKSVEERYLRVEDIQHNDMEEKLKEQMLTDALKELKEPARLAIILRVYLNLPYKQISEITGWSVPKVETLVSRAKNSLREKIILQELGNKNVK